LGRLAALARSLLWLTSCLRCLAVQLSSVGSPCDWPSSCADLCADVPRRVLRKLAAQADLFGRLSGSLVAVAACARCLRYLAALYWLADCCGFRPLWLAGYAGWLRRFTEQVVCAR